MSDRLKQHLFIAPFPPVEGGITLLSEDLVNYLNGSNSISVETLDINFRRPWCIRCLKFIKVIILIPIKIAQSNNVSMHLTARAVLWIGSYISVTCKILKKSLIFRKFAGSFDIDVDRGGNIYRHAVSFIMRNCICLLETEYLVNEFKRRFPDAEIYEFANHRNLNEACVESDKLDIEKVRFVFAGQVKKSKGIGEIIEAISLLNENGYQEAFEFDLYGSIENKSIENLVSAQKGIIYKGIVSHDDLLILLSSYDALILPTYHGGEGDSRCDY